MKEQPAEELIPYSLSFTPGKLKNELLIISNPILETNSGSLGRSLPLSGKLMVFSKVTLLGTVESMCMAAEITHSRGLISESL